MESTAVSVSTLDRLIEHTRDLQFGKVRRTTFYPLVAESFRQTEGQDPELRRALAFQHLLDSVEKVVLPFEKIGGSIIGMWPEVEQPSYEAQYDAAKQYIQDIIDGRRLFGGKARALGLDGQGSLRFQLRISADADHHQASPDGISRQIKRHGHCQSL